MRIKKRKAVVKENKFICFCCQKPVNYFRLIDNKIVCDKCNKLKS